MFSTPQICALLTDFGLEDHYVGVMKAVILREAPTARLVDVNHNVSPFSIIQGSFFLEQCWEYFPTPSVFLAVIDPGVGSQRKRIVYSDKAHYYVGPDNGLISLVWQDSNPDYFCYEINISAPLFDTNFSRTFEGRDIFARTASFLMKGLPLSEFTTETIIQPEINSYRLPTPIKENTWKAHILNIDHFGNVVTNLRWIEDFYRADNLIIRYRDIQYTIPIVSCFSEVSQGSLCSYQGSSHYLEIAVNCGNLSHFLETVNIGDTITIEINC